MTHTHFGKREGKQKVGSGRIYGLTSGRAVKTGWCRGSAASAVPLAVRGGAGVCEVVLSFVSAE